MDKCREQRVEYASSGQTDTDRVDYQRSIEILKNNPAAVARDADCFDEFRQIVPDKNDICTLTGDIGSRAHGDANRGFTECWRVVDAVSQHGDCTALSDLLGDELSFLLGKKFRVNLNNAKLISYGFRGISRVSGE